MANLEREDILKLARLSKLELTEEQIAKYQSELQSIVNFFEQLESVDTEGLEPSFQVSCLTNVTRSDEIKEYAKPVELLKNAPQQQDGHIKVNRMIG